MIYQEISKNDFRDAFNRMDRSENFSFDALGVLFDMLDDLSSCVDIELDVIALCCDYTEYADLAEFWKDYDEDTYPDRASIEESTSVYPVNVDGFIIANF